MCLLNLLRRPATTSSSAAQRTFIKCNFEHFHYSLTPHTTHNTSSNLTQHTVHSFTPTLVVVVITGCSSRVWHGAAASGWLVLGWCSSRPLDSIFSTASYSSRAAPAQPSTTARPGTASTKGTLA